MALNGTCWITELRRIQVNKKNFLKLYRVFSLNFYHGLSFGYINTLLQYTDEITTFDF